MFLVKPIHSIDFLRQQGLGVEVHIGRTEAQPGWERYIPFVRGVHLPYAQCNVAALDPEEREQSVRRLIAAMEESRRYPVDRVVIHTCGLETRAGVRVGDYDIMIRSFRHLSDYAASLGLLLCIENQVLRPPDVRRIYGDSAPEWYGIQKDIDRDNVLLTLDTSHAASSAAIHEDPHEREKALWEFLRHPELIGRVHWSDSCLVGREALYTDMHRIPGKGDLPRAFHQRVLGLQCVTLLEQDCCESDVREGLAFIRGLQRGE